MGRRRRLLLLLWALLDLLRPAAPEEAQRVDHTYENVKLLQISMRPTAAVQISSNEEESPNVQDHSKSTEQAGAKEEEKTLHDLVGVLQDMVQDIPTVKVQNPPHTIPLPTVPLLTKPPVVMETVLEPSQSEMFHTIDVLEPSQPGTVDTEDILEPSQPETVHTVDVLEPPQSETVPAVTVLEPSQSEMIHTVGDSLKPMHEEEETMTPETAILAKEIALAGPTPLLEIESGKSEPVVLHTDQTTTKKPLVSVSLSIEKAPTKKKIESFDQLTNGALSNLEQSLENVKKLNGILDTFTKKEDVDQESKEGKVQKKKPNADDILSLIEKLIKTLKNTPSFVKEDRNLYKYIQTAETYIKEALDLTEKAEDKVQQVNPVLPSTPPSARETEIPLVLVSEHLPVPTVVVHTTSPPPVPLAQKEEDVQVEMGKLKAFINLLYGFSPHLTTYTQNTAHKKVAEDIVERALEVLHAIKSVFCGSEEAESKQTLKRLLQEDMELMHQAMKAKRVS